LNDVGTYASASWCWSRVYATEALNKSDASKRQWIEWAKQQGMTYVLFPKTLSTNVSFILIPSANTMDCEIASSDTTSLQNYDLRLIN
jgi:hypothetical protein